MEAAFNSECCFLFCRKMMDKERAAPSSSMALKLQTLTSGKAHFFRGRSYQEAKKYQSIARTRSVTSIAIVTRSGEIGASPLTLPVCPFTIN